MDIFITIKIQSIFFSLLYQPIFDSESSEILLLNTQILNTVVHNITGPKR